MLLARATTSWMLTGFLFSSQAYKLESRKSFPQKLLSSVTIQNVMRALRCQFYWEHCNRLKQCGLGGSGQKKKKIQYDSTLKNNTVHHNVDVIFVVWAMIASGYDDTERHVHFWYLGMWQKHKEKSDEVQNIMDFLGENMTLFDIEQREVMWELTGDVSILESLCHHDGMIRQVWLSCSDACLQVSTSPE